MPCRKNVERKDKERINYKANHRQAQIVESLKQGNSIEIKARTGGVETLALLDSGATLSLYQRNFLKIFELLLALVFPQKFFLPMEKLQQ